MSAQFPSLPLPILTGGDGVQVALEAGTAKLRHVLTGLWQYATPEEWVRQHLILYLTAKHDYPPGLIATERALAVGRGSKRFDLLVYDRDGQPWLLAECKRPGESIVPALYQAHHYNQTLKCPYLLLTNGEQAELYAWADKAYRPLQALPALPA